MNKFDHLISPTGVVLFIFVLLLLSPGFLLIFIFDKNLFLNLDWIKLIFLSLAVTTPLLLCLCIDEALNEFDPKKKSITDDVNLPFQIIVIGTVKSTFVIFFLCLIRVLEVLNIKINQYWIVQIYLAIIALILIRIFFHLKKIDRNQ